MPKLQREPDDDREPGGGGARFPIAGIGASAGGIKALQAFFEVLPEKLGAAFVVVVHLDPDRSSELPAILGARTRMPCVQVTNHVPLEEDHVYVIPPNRRLMISNDQVKAAAFDEPRGRRAPIDLFLRSLADERGDGFAIILSGSGADGAAGVKAVKEAGGIVLVQEPDEAEFSSMPRAAIATGAADLILPVKELAERLVMLVRNKEDAVRLPDANDELVGRILVHLQVRTGHDFSHYKRSTVLRRIARRRQVTGRSQLADYYAYMSDHPEEVQALFSDLLISVTTFFRDAAAFATLAEMVIPHLFDGRRGNDKVRIWVAGCATGEEAYSVAMLLLEEAERHDPRPELQVFGTDLDAAALSVAREGRYPFAVEADVNERRLARFFTKEGDHYKVRRELRDTVLFANHDLLRDPPFSHLDLILCRNLLIYFDRRLQDQACAMFHYALNPGGCLFLGASETVGSPNLFRVVERSARIFQSVGSRKLQPMVPRLSVGGRTAENLEAAMPVQRPYRALDEARLHREILESLAPPSILVDRGGRAVHLSESAGRFLLPRGGVLSDELSELVRPEIRLDLVAALHRAFEHGQPTISMPLEVQFDGAPHRVVVHVQPMPGRPGSPAHRALVFFLDGGPVEPLPAEGPVPALARIDRDVDETIRRLREEVSLGEARLKTTREEAETVTEELRAANEELQSLNEEYRSTAEELETSKEELQSSNEELQTVNNELKLKLDNVSKAHDDLQNLITITDYGTLFLDTELRIKLFTPRISDLFNIKPGDEGRLVTDFTNRLDYAALSSDARKVLADLTPVEKECRAGDDDWYVVRLRPYRTADNKIDGVVAAFVNISERRRAEEEMRASEVRHRREATLIARSGLAMLIWELDGTILEWTRGCERLYGYSRAEALGRQRDALLATAVRGSSFADVRRRLADANRWSGHFQDRHKDGSEIAVEANIELISEGGGHFAIETHR